MTEQDQGQPGADVTSAADSSPAASSPDVKPAESSAAEGVETSLVDTVKAVLTKGSEDSPASGKGEEKSSPESDPDADIDSLPEEVSRRTKNAFDRLRSKIDEAERKSETFKSGAEKFEKIVSYMETNGIESQEFDNALAVTALIKRGDYTKALEVLTPIYRELASRAGEVLPAELQERVRLGYITEQDARELHRQRTRASNVEAQRKAETERTARQRASQEAQQIGETSARAADDWAKAKAGSDPDWHLKQDLVAEQVKLDLLDRKERGDQDWFPKTPQEVVSRAEAALKVVEERMKKFAPRPQAKTVPQGSPSSPRAKAQPGSMMEAVYAAIGR